MKTKQFRNILDECCNDVTFSLDTKKAGIFPEVINGTRIYHVCYGDAEKEYTSLDVLMSDPFFDGHSIQSAYKRIGDISC